jgi:hypothetical protein
LRRHGATGEEVDFLSEDRVKLNGMTSRQFIDFVEAKLAEHGIEKVVPKIGTIEAHGRRLIEQRRARNALADIRQRLADEAASTSLPDDIEGRLRDYFARHPALPWDEALAIIINGSDAP